MLGQDQNQETEMLSKHCCLPDVALAGSEQELEIELVNCAVD